MKLSDLLQRYATPSPQLGEEQKYPAVTPSPSVECQGETLHQAIDHTGPPAAANNESHEQCSHLSENPFQGVTSQSVAVQVWSDVLQAPVWVVGDDLPQAEWPQDGPVYTHKEVRFLTNVGQDVLRWVDPLKEIFNAKVVAAHSAPKRNQSSYRRQQHVDI